MRYFIPQFEFGDTIIRSWFAILPVHINGEVRWLERVTVKQQCTQKLYSYYWKNIEFVDNPNEK